MSATHPDFVRTCPRCSTELPLGSLACGKCHALLYASELERISEEAKRLESSGDLSKARESWLSCLRLLPPQSKQVAWILDRAKALDHAAEQMPVPESENRWTQKLGPIGPIAILLAKSKGILLALFKLKFLLSFASFLLVYSSLYGINFGLGFALLILVHELGHFIDIKRRGLPADMPVFLPGLGAYVRWRGLGVSTQTKAAISLAGPLAGALAAVACTLMWWKTGNGLWAALARTGAALNILNLIPVWVLDGGQAAEALSRLERIGLLTLCLALWLILGEGVFFLVAIGAGYRVFTKDLPPRPSLATSLYFALVLISLGMTMHSLPGHGFGGE